MELWTEYEGRTIEGGIALNKLVAPQGRSAFFSTANTKGEPTLIRLVACHFDEEEILARWRGVQALNHPNFFKLEQYGQLTLDDTKVVYAVFEHADANLAQVVGQGRLGVPDVTQLVASLVSALEMLHMNGFIHEHLEPENVFAVGEVVKLRTDCIRETPEGTEGLEAKRRDVHDLAVVVLQALTQERNLEAATRRRPLPAPFDQIVPKALSGEWGLAEISAALRLGQAKARPVAASAAVPPASTAPRSAAPPAASASARPEVSSERKAVPEAKKADTVSPSLRSHVRPEHRPLEDGRSNKWIPVAALVGLLLLWIGWISFHHRSPRTATSDKQPVISKSGLRPIASVNPSRAGKPATSVSQNTAHIPVHSAGAAREQWRVVAFTYNHQDQAQKKSSAIAQRHPELHPGVFSPSGHAPYLVTIGGAMNRDEAYALAHKSRGLGLPRDTYAQNYTAR